MEEFKKEKKEQEIVFSKSVKAGKRVYYLDVKRSRNNDFFLAITESKKKITEEGESGAVLYEKHKIFLYKEDFDKFTSALTEVLDFIKAGNASVELENDENSRFFKDDSSYAESKPEPSSKYDFDIDFEI